MSHPTIIKLNRSQLLLNIAIIKNHLGPKVKFCFPIKANAYGHGLIEIASIASSVVDYFAVSCLAEVASLRSAGINNKIIVLGALEVDNIAQLINYDSEFTVAANDLADLILYCKTNNMRAKVQLKIDTGMHRLGVLAAEATKLIDLFLANSQFVKLVGIYSHLANSEIINDFYTEHQLTKFATLAQEFKSFFPQLICHIAASGGVLNYPHSCYDMVRVGILTYGYLPSTLNSDSWHKIKPILSLISKVVEIKELSHGASISYGQKYILNTNSKIAVVPIGYGDGYARNFSNKAQALIRGKKFSQVGIICMDMMMLNLANDQEIAIGDEVVLIGSQATAQINLEQLALLDHTISYEICTRFSARIPRIII